MDPVGSIDLLRTTLGMFFKARLRCFLGARPASPESPQGKYRTAVFDLFLLGATESEERRKAVIADFMNGDWCNEGGYVEHFCPHGHCINKEHCLKRFQNDVVMALLPHSLPTFPRHRWTGGEKALDWAGLLASLGVLREPIIVWMACLRENRTPQESDFAPKLVQEGWEHDEIEIEPATVETNSEDVDWKAFHAKLRRNGERFARANPVDRLVLMRVAMTPLVDLLHRFGAMGDRGWEQKNMADAAAGLPFKYRIVECYQGSLTKPFFQQVAARLFDESSWPALRQDGKTEANSLMSFLLLSRAGAVITHLVSAQHTTYPFKLFGVLSDPEHMSEMVASDARCLMCTFTLKRLESFGLCPRYFSESASPGAGAVLVDSGRLSAANPNLEARGGLQSTVRPESCKW